uniref:Uncharacterized protein n=1 Tax=Globisporangium ultimum (strain ATCC 200006 / CBS 805.95 / DAOM BR144) TaxID=431595 RepID=K3X202_GLOUD
MLRKLLGRKWRQNRSVRERETKVFTPIMELVAAHVDGVAKDTAVTASTLSKRSLADLLVDDGTMNAVFDPELTGSGPGEEDLVQTLQCEFDPEFCFPKIVGIRLPDILTDDQSLEQNHAILLEFAHATNRPNVATKRDIDRYILFTEYVGDEMVGHWIADGQVLKIQVLEINTDKVKPLKDLMQGLLQTTLRVPDEDDPESEEVDTTIGDSVEAITMIDDARFRIEPPGLYYEVKKAHSPFGHPKFAYAHVMTQRWCSLRPWDP